jgi:hypothetical protein
MLTKFLPLDGGGKVGVKSPHPALPYAPPIKGGELFYPNHNLFNSALVHVGVSS